MTVQKSFLMAIITIAACSLIIHWDTPSRCMEDETRER